ncbi:MAG TPA: hypothetical protein VGV59_07060 [Pyrinomonadaceae bacterium]|nr:hypothetical protein [Pyrinomonadaceae bacterium]
MERQVVGIFHNPWRSEYDPHRSVAELYRRAVWLKSNPRDEEYMKALFSERYPAGEFVNIDRDADWQAHLAAAETVVLLYPDAIGLHFAPVESAVLKGRKSEAVEVRVLNGRRRDFVWSSRVRRELRWRRLAERAMLGEALMIVGFVVITPFFVAADFVRGRR